MSNESQRRPCFISAEEYELRWKLAHGMISSTWFNRRLKEIHKAKQSKTRTRKKGEITDE